MQRMIAFSIVSAIVAVCGAAPTANEDFVLAEDARTYTNAVNAAKEYTDTQIAAAEPGNYAAVSNAAMNAAAAVRVSGGTNSGVVVSCDWFDGDYVLPWVGVDQGWLYVPGHGRLGGNRSLMYNDGDWEYRPSSANIAYTNSVPIYGLPQALTLYCGPSSVTLVRTNEVYSSSNEYSVAYMDDLLIVAKDATNYTDRTIANVPAAVSNIVTQSYVEGLGISSEETDPVWSSDKSNYATRQYADDTATNAVAPVVAIVNSWESYWGGSNVVFEVTNYYGNTTGAKPRLRIREYRDEQWRTVWDEENKFAAAESNIVNRVAETNAALRVALKEEFAPLAWGTVTDKGSPNPVTNTTFMTSPETYFAGGTEYQRVAVGSGTICVLVDKGALARTAGQPGTFRFQDDGGTNYFGFVKTDSYTIGCRTDGITVADGLVTLRYDVIMGGTDVPVVYWRENLREGSWVQLNNVDGTAADGAPYTVTWYTSGGSYYAAINCTGNASGFFRAETAVMGDVVWETNMRARLGGGMECTNTATHVNGVIRPSYNGSSVTWTWSLR